MSRRLSYRRPNSAERAVLQQLAAGARIVQHGRSGFLELGRERLPSDFVRSLVKRGWVTSSDLPLLDPNSGRITDLGRAELADCSHH